MSNNFFFSWGETDKLRGELVHPAHHSLLQQQIKYIAATCC